MAEVGWDEKWAGVRCVSGFWRFIPLYLCFIFWYFDEDLVFSLSLLFLIDLVCSISFFSFLFPFLFFPRYPTHLAGILITKFVYEDQGELLWELVTDGIKGRDETGIDDWHMDSHTAQTIDVSKYRRCFH